MDVRYIGFIRTVSLLLCLKLSVSLKKTEIKTEHMAVGRQTETVAEMGRGQAGQIQVVRVGGAAQNEDTEGKREGQQNHRWRR